MAAPQGTDFIVHLDAVNIPDKDRAAVSRAIQAATLTELAKLDLGGALGFRIPRREWLGIWLERLGGQEPPIPKVTIGRP
jgi:hypothetical protein